MFEVSGLSKKDIQEEYEDLVFRKVMAIYVENESKQILAEIKAEKESNNEPIDTKAVEKLYDKKERRENLGILWKYSKKVVSFAAMIVFVAIVSLSSAVVAFADVREAMIDAIYHLLYEDNERYTRIEIGENTGFINPEIFDWDGAYAPTYLPEGFVFENISGTKSQHSIDYNYGNDFISFIQVTNSVIQVDTENADIIQEIVIGDSNGLFVVKKNITCITWSIGDTALQLLGTASPDEMVKTAEGIKIFK